MSADRRLNLDNTRLESRIKTSLPRAPIPQIIGVDRTEGFGWLTTVGACPGVRVVDLFGMSASEGFEDAFEGVPYPRRGLPAGLGEY